MGTPREQGAASVAPPVDAYVLASVTTSAAIKLPAVFNDKNVTFAAETVDVWIRFGVATLTVLETAVSTLTASVPAVATNGAFIVPAGQSRDFDMRNVVSTAAIENGGSADSIWFAHKSSATTGFLRFYPSEGTVVNQS